MNLFKTWDWLWVLPQKKKPEHTHSKCSCNSRAKHLLTDAVDCRKSFPFVLSPACICYTFYVPFRCAGHCIWIHIPAVERQRADGFLWTFRPSCIRHPFPSRLIVGSQSPSHINGWKTQEFYHTLSWLGFLQFFAKTWKKRRLPQKRAARAKIVKNKQNRELKFMCIGWSPTDVRSNWASNKRNHLPIECW